VETITLPTRVAPAELAAVDALAAEAGLDRSAVTKSLVRRGIRELCLDQAVEAYAAQRITLSRAAEIAQIPVADFLIHLERRQPSLHYDVSDLQDDLSYAR